MSVATATSSNLTSSTTVGAQSILVQPQAQTSPSTPITKRSRAKFVVWLVGTLRANLQRLQPKKGTITAKAVFAVTGTIIGTCLAGLALWPSFIGVDVARKANLLAQWTARKDFYEFCESHDWKEKGCNEAKSHPPGSPPFIGRSAYGLLPDHGKAINFESIYDTERTPAPELLLFATIVACGVVVSLRHRATRRLILRICRPWNTPKPAFRRGNPGSEKQPATVTPVPFGSNMKYDFKFKPSWFDGAEAATTGFNTENHGSYTTRRAVRRPKGDIRTIPRAAVSAGRNSSPANTITSTTQRLPGVNAQPMAVLDSLLDDRGSFKSSTQPVSEATEPHQERRVMRGSPPVTNQPPIAVHRSKTRVTGFAPARIQELRNDGHAGGSRQSTQITHWKAETLKVDIHSPFGSPMQEMPVKNFDIHWPKIEGSRLTSISLDDPLLERELHDHRQQLHGLMLHLSNRDLPSTMPNSLTRRVLKRGLRPNYDYFHDKLWQSRNRMIHLVTSLSSRSRWALVAKNYAHGSDFYMDLPRRRWSMTRREPLGGVDGLGVLPITISPLTSHSTWSRTTNGRMVMSGGGDTRHGSALSLLESSDSTTPPDRYIVMGAVEAGTIGSIWGTVVKQIGNPGVIVMLRGTEETGCCPYFPNSPHDAPLEVDQWDESGEGFRALVSCEAFEETEAGEAVELRRLKLRIYRRSRVEAESSGEHGTMPHHPIHGNGDVKIVSSPNTEPDEEGITNGNNSAGSVTSSPNRPYNGDQEEPESSQSRPPYDRPSLGVDYEDRVIYHFTYKRWPISGVPALEDLDGLLALMRLSRSLNSSSSTPRIVHCSAGVNPIGIFVALDHLLGMFEARVLKHLANASNSDGTATATWIECEGLIYHIVQALCEQHMWADNMFRALYQLAGKLWRDRWAQLEKRRRGRKKETSTALDSG